MAWLIKVVCRVLVLDDYKTEKSAHVSPWRSWSSDVSWNGLIFINGIDTNWLFLEQKTQSNGPEKEKDGVIQNFKRTLSKKEKKKEKKRDKEFARIPDGDEEAFSREDGWASNQCFCHIIVLVFSFCAKRAHLCVPPQGQPAGCRGVQGHAGDQLHTHHLQPGGGDEEEAAAEAGEADAGVQGQRRKARLW